MWPFLANLIGGPIISGALNAYKAKLAAGNTKDKIEADLAVREYQVQQRELELRNERHLNLRWYDPASLLGYIMVGYIGKVIVYDKMLGWGSTDPITGDVLTWAGMIMIFHVGTRGVISVARVLRG